MKMMLDGECDTVAFAQPLIRTSPSRSVAAFSHLMNADSEAVRVAWCQVIAELRELRSLTDDWDGDGAAAPGVAVVDTALSQANRLRREYHNPPDRVIVGVNGSIVLEWWQFDRIQQMEILSPDEIEVRIGGKLLPNSTDSRPIH